MPRTIFRANSRLLILSRRPRNWNRVWSRAGDRRLRERSDRSYLFIYKLCRRITISVCWRNLQRTRYNAFIVVVNTSLISLLRERVDSFGPCRGRSRTTRRPYMSKISHGTFRSYGFVEGGGRTLIIDEFLNDASTCGSTDRKIAVSEMRQAGTWFFGLPSRVRLPSSAIIERSRKQSWQSGVDGH